MDGAKAVCENCSFEWNKDGGVSIVGNCELANCVFNSNSGNFGAILFADEPQYRNPYSVSVSGCTFRGNSGAQLGTCIHFASTVVSSNLSVDGCLFESETATAVYFAAASGAAFGSNCFPGPSGLQVNAGTTVTALNIRVYGRLCFAHDEAGAVAGAIAFVPSGELARIVYSCTSCWQYEASATPAPSVTIPATPTESLTPAETSSQSPSPLASVSVSPWPSPSESSTPAASESPEQSPDVNWKACPVGDGYVGLGDWRDCTFNKRNESGSSLTGSIYVIRCTFTKIKTEKHGGSVRLVGPFTAVDCVWEECGSPSGGGVAVQGAGNLGLFERCVFKGCNRNTNADFQDGAWGGALAGRAGARIRCESCNFTSNKDGALSIIGACELVDCRITSNTGYFGGLFARREASVTYLSDVSLTRCVFGQNSGTRAGQSVHFESATNANGNIPFTADGCLFEPGTWASGAAGIYFGTTLFAAAFGSNCFSGNVRHISATSSRVITVSGQLCFANLAGTAVYGGITFSPSDQEHVRYSCTTCSDGAVTPTSSDAPLPPAISASSSVDDSDDSSSSVVTHPPAISTSSEDTSSSVVTPPPAVSASSSVDDSDDTSSSVVTPPPAVSTSSSVDDSGDKSPSQGISANSPSQSSGKGPLPLQTSPIAPSSSPKAGLPAASGTVSVSDPALASPTPSRSASPPGQGVGDGGGQDSGAGLSGGAVSGIVIGILAAVAAAGVAVWWVCGTKRNMSQYEYPVAEMDHTTIDDFDAWAAAGGSDKGDVWGTELAPATDTFVPRSAGPDMEFAPKFE
jgi:hypothetical protein